MYNVTNQSCHCLWRKKIFKSLFHACSSCMSIIILKSVVNILLHQLFNSGLRTLQSKDRNKSRHKSTSQYYVLLPEFLYVLMLKKRGKYKNG